MLRTRIKLIRIRIPLFQFDTDPDPTLHFDADLILIRRFTLKPISILDAYSISPPPPPRLHFVPPHLHCERLRQSVAPFWAPTTPAFWLWCRSRSEKLLVSVSHRISVAHWSGIYLSYIYLGYFVCLCVIVCVCLCVTIAERTAILLVLIIKLTKEARWMDWRWRF